MGRQVLMGFQRKYRVWLVRQSVNWPKARKRGELVEGQSLELVGIEMHGVAAGTKAHRFDASHQFPAEALSPKPPGAELVPAWVLPVRARSRRLHTRRRGRNKPLVRPNKAPPQCQPSQTPQAQSLPLAHLPSVCLESSVRPPLVGDPGSKAHSCLRHRLRTLWGRSRAPRSQNTRSSAEMSPSLGCRSGGSR
jgi:hypothetical protein